MKFCHMKRKPFGSFFGAKRTTDDVMQKICISHKKRMDLRGSLMCCASSASIFALLLVAKKNEELRAEKKHLTCASRRWQDQVADRRRVLAGVHGAGIVFGRRGDVGSGAYRAKVGDGVVRLVSQCYCLKDTTFCKSYHY